MCMKYTFSVEPPGHYHINVDNVARKVYCDQALDHGGWTLVLSQRTHFDHNLRYRG